MARVIPWILKNQSYLHGLGENELWHQGFDTMYKKYNKKAFNKAIKSYGTKYKHSARYKKRKRAYTSRAKTTKRARIGLLGDAPKAGIRCKKNLILTNGAIQLDTKTLRSNNLALFPKRRDATGVTWLQGRERDALIWKGFSMDVTLTNNTTTPMYCVAALLIPKNQAQVTTTNFFMNNGEASTRHKTFATTLSAMEYKNPINTDDYIVLKKWTHTIGGKPPDNDPTNGQTFVFQPDKPNWYRIKQWIPINRKMTFGGLNDEEPDNGKLFFCTWTCNMGASSAEPAVTGGYALEEKFVNYFKDSSG